jgi:hypothetical protein
MDWQGKFIYCMVKNIFFSKLINIIKVQFQQWKVPCHFRKKKQISISFKKNKKIILKWLRTKKHLQNLASFDSPWGFS